MTKIIICILAGLLFPASLIAHIYIKVRFSPGREADFDDYYHEFEESHPAYARYEKWSRITFVAATISALLLFIGVVL